MPQEVSPADLDAQRRKALEERYAKGQRLSPEQLAEIGKGPPPPSGQEKLELEADGPGYKHDYAWYAANLQVWDPETTIASRVRTIKRWVADGRAHSPKADAPPFDTPDQLAAWWTRVKRRKVPDRVMAIAAPPRVEGSAAPPAPAAPGNIPPTEQLIDMTNMAALGPLERLEQMRRLVNARFQLFETALAKGDPSAEIKGRAYRELSAELRKAELDAEELREARGELIPRDALRAELQRVHTAIASCIRSAARSLALAPDLEERLIAEAFRPLTSAAFGLGDTAPANPQTPAPPSPVAA